MARYKRNLTTKRGRETVFGHVGPSYSGHRNVTGRSIAWRKKGTMVIPKTTKQQTQSQNDSFPLQDSSVEDAEQV